MKVFEKFVRELDDQGLADLNKALERESGERAKPAGVQLQEIHPNMPEEKKHQVWREIARILRGED